MWIMLNNSFLSIVHKDCDKKQLLVRARRAGDIEQLFPNAVVTSYDKSDYRYRAVVARGEVSLIMARLAWNIDYPNFKDSVKDEALHDAYLNVWHDMMALQHEETIDD